MPINAAEPPKQTQYDQVERRCRHDTKVAPNGLCLSASITDRLAAILHAGPLDRSTLMHPQSHGIDRVILCNLLVAD
jgi:hypothetical protein